MIGYLLINSCKYRFFHINDFTGNDMCSNNAFPDFDIGYILLSLSSMLCKKKAIELS